MLVFTILAAILVAVVYYISSGKETEEAKQTSAPAQRKSPARKDQNTHDRRRSRNNTAERRKKEGPDVHPQKVREKAREAFNSATRRAEVAEKEGGLDELAVDSYLVAESLRKMFCSEEFFDEEAEFGSFRRFDSFRTAVEVAEDARDRLIDIQKKKMHRTELKGLAASDYVKEKYVRHVVESGLMIAWSAGGLIGKSRYESAQEVFRFPVSAEEVQSWEQFGQVLRKESEHYITAERLGD
jgi:hypothetical protein